MMFGFSQSHIKTWTFLVFFATLFCRCFLCITQCYSDCLIGNSNLLSVIDDRGAINTIRWEKIWGENQLANPVSLKTTDGVISGSTLLLLKSQKSLYSLYSYTDSKTDKQTPYIPVAVTRGKVPPIGVDWEQKVFVHPTENVLCYKLSLSGNVEILKDSSLIAFFNFLLSPPPIKDNPFMGYIDEFRRCNIIYWSDEVSGLVFLRPFNLSKSDYLRFEEGLKKKLPFSKVIRRFEDGVCVAVFSPGTTNISMITSKGSIMEFPPGWRLTSLKVSPPEGKESSIYVSLNILPSCVLESGSVEFYVYLVFARNYLELVDIVNRVKCKPYVECLADVEKFWKQQYEQREAKTLSPSDWLRLMLSTERSTGAILPEAEKSNTISIVECSLLVSRLLELGLQDIAKQQMLFWVDVVRNARKAGRFAVPSYVYPDGISAVPDYQQDISANAMYLYLCNRVVSTLPVTERKFVSDVWDTIMWAGNQMTIWRVPGEYSPAPSFSDSAKVDLVSINQILRMLIGISSAQTLCKLTNSAIPDEWLQFEKELQLWIRLAVLSENRLPVFWEKDIIVWKTLFSDEDVMWSLPVFSGKEKYILKDFIKDSCSSETTIILKNGN